jgi:3-mercaptopyruvate sulfurtransferase SseA
MEFSSLVSPHWLNEQLENTAVQILECACNASLYETAHIPGAVRIPGIPISST